VSIENIKIQYESKIGQKLLKEVIDTITRIHDSLDYGITNIGEEPNTYNKESVLSDLVMSTKLLSFLIDNKKNKVNIDTLEVSVRLNKTLEYLKLETTDDVEAFVDQSNIKHNSNEGYAKELLSTANTGRKVLIEFNTIFHSIISKPCKL